ncbi:MAG: InlB B-repeat-containing protein [Myxococcota bacterium]
MNKGFLQLLLAFTVVTTLACGSSYSVTAHVAVVKGAEEEAQGEVRSTPPGLHCPSRCSMDVEERQGVTLQAVPSPGWAFVGWEGACDGVGACTLHPREDTTVTARFAPMQNLHVERTGLGQGTVEAGGTCPDACERSFPWGTSVTLRATPAVGSRFTGWGGACSGDSPCVLTLAQDRTVTARFDPLPGMLLDTRTLRHAPEQLGPVTVNGQGKTLVVLHEGQRAIVEEVGDNDEQPAAAVSLAREDFSKVHALINRGGGGYFLAGTAAHDDCVFARLDEGLSLKWRRVIANCGSASHAASLTAAGAPVVFAGTFGSLGSTLDFEGTPLRTRGGRDLFVSRYDDRGVFLSVHAVGSRSDDELLDVATGPNGDVVLSWCGGSSCFLTVMGADGGTRWEQRYPRSAMTVGSVVYLPTGVVAAAGQARVPRGSATVFGTPLAPGRGSLGCGASTGFVALLDGTEGHLRSLVALGRRVADLVARTGGLVAAVVETPPPAEGQETVDTRRQRARRPEACPETTLRVQALTQGLDAEWQLALPYRESGTRQHLGSTEGTPLLVWQVGALVRSNDEEYGRPTVSLTRVQ